MAQHKHKRTKRGRENETNNSHKGCLPHIHMYAYIHIDAAKPRFDRATCYVVGKGGSMHREGHPETKNEYTSKRRRTKNQISATIDSNSSISRSSSRVGQKCHNSSVSSQKKECTPKLRATHTINTDRITNKSTSKRWWADRKKQTKTTSNNNYEGRSQTSCSKITQMSAASP